MSFTETKKQIMSDPVEEPAGRKAALFLERAEQKLKRHLMQEGNCVHVPFENCPTCGGEDLRKELAALYEASGWHWKLKR